MLRLWFEALPSRRVAEAAAVEDDVQALAPLAALGVERILVPEVLDGEYQTVDPAAFAAAAQRETGIPAVVALGTRDRPAEALAKRVEATASLGLSGLLLVGGRSSAVEYPGPSVADALRSLGGRHHVGVVTIPTRQRPGLPEVQRLLAKQKAGARFAVSQILLEPATALALRRDQVEAAKATGDEPLPILWSLAPVCGPRDLAFLTRLGVHVPEDLAASWHGLDAQERTQASLDIAVDVARTLLEAHAREGLGRVGFCVSHVRMANVPAAVELVRRLRALAPAS